MTYDHWKTTNPADEELGNKEQSEMQHIESPQEWIFTFGCGQPNDKRFVRITGTYVSAREEMFRRYGRKWSMQYSSEEKAGVQRFDLRELSTHMPGPWFYQEKSDGYTHIVRAGGPELGNHFICQLGQDRSGVAEANARLIASAPELLEVAKCALSLLEKWASERSHINRIDNCIVSLKQAIAKAQGNP